MVLSNSGNILHVATVLYTQVQYQLDACTADKPFILVE